MKKPCILRILSTMLAHQTQMAEALANPQTVDLGHRRRICEGVYANAAEFKRLHDEFQMQVEPRALLPKQT